LVSVWCICSCLFFFFFQAEDGIRDFHVTGVQTCALPILDKKALEAKFLDDTLTQEAIEKLAADLQRIIKELETKEMRWFELSERSEERRVGKEWRSS